VNSFRAFLKKEFLAQWRTGKLMLLAIVFILFGIMNPAVAKLTPWLLEIVADSLAESGMIITDVTVTAMDSWVQFFKNIPMALIVFILVQGSIFTTEYQSGTLVLSLTKGMGRHWVVLAKASVPVLLWTLGFWLCFAITYCYNAWFWDNAVARHLLFSALCLWVFGLWVIALAVFFSTVSTANTGVLLGTGGTVLAGTLLGLLPKLRAYMPTLLTEGTALICSQAETADYVTALWIAGGTGILLFIAAFPLFAKKQL